MFEAQRTGRAGRYGKRGTGSDLVPAVMHTEDFT